MNADWDHLKVVLAISRGGSLTAAANLLDMDQTTAGRRLNAIEAQLGTVLFQRAKSGFTATEAGQVVIENALRIESRLTRMQEAIDEAKSDAGGVLRLASNTWILQRLAEHILPGFMAEHPKIEMRLSGRLPPAPIFSEPSVSLWFDAPPVASDQATPLCSIGYTTYQAKGFDQDNSCWVQFQDDLALGPSFTRQLRRRLGENASVRLTATDAQILQGSIKSGFARGVLPICLGDRDETLERTTDGKVIQRVLHFHASADARLLKRVQALHDHLINTMTDVFDSAPLRSAKL